MYFRNYTVFPALNHADGYQHLTTQYNEIVASAKPYELSCGPDYIRNYGTLDYGVIATNNFPFKNYYTGQRNDVFFTCNVLGTQYTVQVMENYYAHDSDFILKGPTSGVFDPYSKQDPYDYYTAMINTSGSSKQSGRNIHTYAAICRSTVNTAKPTTENYTKFAIVSVPVADRWLNRSYYSYQKWIAGTFHAPFNSSNFGDVELNKTQYTKGLILMFPFLSQKICDHLGILTPAERPGKITGEYIATNGMKYYYRILMSITSMLTTSNVVNYEACKNHVIIQDINN